MTICSAPFLHEAQMMCAIHKDSQKSWACLFKFKEMLRAMCNAKMHGTA